MSRSSFWSGVAAGAAGSIAGIWAAGLLLPWNKTVHVDRSLQISRPVDDVFSAFARIERLPQLIRILSNVTACEDISVWTAQIDGRLFKWDIELVQVLPKQMIGWKSYRGPRHSGQIRFFALGQSTLVHIEMNYVSSKSFSRSFFLGDFDSWSIGDAIEAGLREMRTALESTRPRWVAAHPGRNHEPVTEQATGTYGPVLRGPRRENLEKNDSTAAGDLEHPPGHHYQ